MNYSNTAESATDRAREISDAALIDAPFAGNPISHDDDVYAVAATLTASECHDYIDMSDVDFTPGDVLGRWQDAVAEAVIEAAKDGDIWALEFVSKHRAEQRARKSNLKIMGNILEGRS